MVRTVWAMVGALVFLVAARGPRSSRGQCVACGWGRVFVHDGTDTDWEYVGWRFFSVVFPLGVALVSSVRYATHLSHGGETAGLRLLRRIGCFVGRLTRVFARKAGGV